MKAIADYLREMSELWPQAGASPTRPLVDLCLEGVQDHPDSSVLWYDLGIVMELCDETCDFTVDDYRRCYENAIRHDPSCSEAHRELGYVLDVYFSEFENAAECFRTAIRLGTDHESYYGYARVLAELGRTEDALTSLGENACPFHDHPDIVELRSEIAAGLWNP